MDRNNVSNALNEVRNQ